MHIDQLYLDECQRRFYISEIDSFSKLYNDRIFPNLENIEQEAKKIAKTLFGKLCGKSCLDPDTIDIAELAEEAEEEGISFYQTVTLFRYQILALGIASLYHLWEQQVRGFLYREISHIKEIKPANFCCKFENIKKRFKEYGVDIKSFPSYKLLNEHRLITNVIKHGDGKSREDLSSVNSSLLKNNRGFDFRLSSLLEETLNIDKKLFFKYVDTLIKFWKWLPEIAQKQSLTIYRV